MTNSTLEGRTDGLTEIASPGGGPRLLVSVRDAREAAATMAGGAAVIDVKEPANGPLGAAGVETVRSILNVVAGRVPVTAAYGELADLRCPLETPPGLCAGKVGLAGLARQDWRALFNEASKTLDPSFRVVPAAYADALKAESPPAEDVLRFAADSGIDWMVLDTWDKSCGDLFDSVSDRQIASFLALARKRRVQVVLAGSLRCGRLTRAASLGPKLIGVRGAACRGGRSGTVRTDLVEDLVHQLDGCRPGR